MRQLFVLLLSVCFSGIFIACNPRIPAVAEPGEIELFPDYRGVTIPANIAPLNFKIVNEQYDGIIRLKTCENEFVITADKGVINIPLKVWRMLIREAVGEQIDVTVYYSEDKNRWKRMDFPIFISSDTIDGYLTYRRIFPGYRMWNEMGIYQRNVENFVEKTIIDNRSTNNSCMNCHSFCDRQGERFLFHQRGAHGGTYLVDHQQVTKIALESNGQPVSFVYPYWHPSGRYVAFSTNETHQDFHLVDKNRIEVYDVKSDILIYDTQLKCAYSSPLLASSSFETYPTFTPDGKSLLFCSADSVSMPEEYKKVRYHILRIAFDPEHGALGTHVDTLYNAREMHRSAIFPRVSPDGKRLLYTVSDYGSFSIWHKDADLYMMDLQTGTIDSLLNVNSQDVESYHSWSANSRWFVFSSRREDGLFTRPYITHVDERGKCSKPFLLPQEIPDYYGHSLFSFNIPELSSTPALVTKDRLIKASREEDVMLIKGIRGL